MNFENIKNKIEAYKADGKRLFTTSSFQSHSLVLLHMLSRIDNTIPIAFINTGYHFPETVRFRDEVSRAFGMKFIDVKPNTPKSMQRTVAGHLLFVSDPDYCCYLNKTQPLEAVLQTHDIWINGVRADQSATRSAMRVEQAAPHGVTRFHPILDWNAKMIYEYQKEYDLPKHPLEPQGFLSIGCEPCTRKMDLEMQERETRWFGMNKTECGLHTELINK